MISPAHDPSNDISGTVFPSGTGRYAPSPSGDLHLGNLRTAILAWAMARRGGKSFYMRVEDLDRVRPGAAERQLADLRAMGLDWDVSPGSAAESTEGKGASSTRARALPPTSVRFSTCARRASSTSATAPAARFRRPRAHRTARRAPTRAPAAT